VFNRAIHTQTLLKYLSSDHDPLYRFHQWQANLRVLEMKEIKTVPYVTLSHPFVERLIGTIRREYLDQTLFWTAADLENKLRLFRIISIDNVRTRAWEDDCQILRRRDTITLFFVWVAATVAGSTRLPSPVISGIRP
jgi:hypothetical protein